MIANALIVTIAILLGLGFWLLGELQFLVPYRHALLRECGLVLLLWFLILFTNVFAAIYALQRKVFLKDTGRKLSHIDQQVAAGHAPVPAPETHPEED
jgi:hypothetical protein